jgi:hypothetical protein
MNLFPVLARIPKKYFARSKPLIDAMLLSQKAMSWDPKLRLVVDETAISDTDIVQLIMHAIRRQSGEDAPNGFEEFVHGLKRIGVEPEWVKDEYAQEILSAISSDEDEDDDDTSDDDDDDTDDDTSDDDDGGIDDDGDDDDNDDDDDKEEEDSDHEMNSGDDHEDEDEEDEEEEEEEG